MKKKVTKSIIILLVTLLIILIANIIVGIHSNSSVNATEYCSYCGRSTILDENNYRNNSQHWTKRCWNCSRLLNAEAHQCGNIIKQDAKYHYRKCSECEGEIYESHSGGTHTNQGKCTVCGEQYQTHSTTKKGEPTGVGSHKEVYSCTYSGCTWKQDGATVSCSGGTHANGGICTVCGGQYQTHTWTTTTYSLIGTNKHRLNYKCIYSGCTETKYGEIIDCFGGNHENNGKCTACKRTYQTHTMEDMGYKKTGTASHVKIFECTYQGCDEQSIADEGECTNGTHQNGGICQTCFFQYQTHGQSSNILRYTKTEEQHRAIYKCLCTECGITYSGVGKEHNVEQWKDNENGTHTGKCTVCSYEKTVEHVYEEGKCNECGAMKPENESCDHIYVNKNNDTQHWQECSNCNQIKEGSLETHIIENHIDNENGTHTEKCTKCTYEGTVEHTYDENGKCVCGKVEQKEEPECTHTYEKNNDETKHWDECTLCHDKQNEENHTGATHENGGLCEVCRITYEQHQQSTKIKDYTKTSTGHTPNYECTFKGCTVKYPGQEADHEYGTCTNQEDGTHLATCSVCTQEMREEHIYENGRCDKCGAVEPDAGTNTECVHSYEKRNNEIQHWEVCTKCNEVKKGSLVEHTISNYVDNKNGTHTGKCSGCDYQFTEKHNYKDSKCTNCGSDKTAENGNINNNNGDTNNNVNNDTNNGNKDNSTSQNGIPKAGFNGEIIAAIVAIGTVLLLLAIKMKKYKDI